MPSRELLSPVQRAAFRELPAPLGARLLARYYTLSTADRLYIHQHRTPANRLGVAVQLCYLRFPGRALDPGEAVSPDLLAYLAEQLRLAPAAFAAYAQRDPTRREHLAALQRAFDFQPFTARAYIALAHDLLPLALSTDDGLALVTALVEACRRQRLLLPAILTLERLAWGVRRRAQREVAHTLTAPLSPAQRQQLQSLLRVPDEGHVIPLTWLRQPPGPPSPRTFLGIVKRLEFIRALGLPPLPSTHPNRLLQLARDGSRSTPQRLRLLPPDQAEALLVAFLHHRATELTDLALDIHDRIVGKLFNRSEYKQASAFIRSSRAINEKVRLYAQIGQAIIVLKETGEPDVFAAITAVLPWERFVTSVEEATKLARPADFDFLDLLITRYPYLRQYSPALLATFEFKAAPSHQVLLTALAVLHDLNTRQRKKLPKSVPTAFVPPRWEKLVFTAQGVDRRYYELCALAELRNGLRAGDIWVAGSRQFKDLEDYLLPTATWQELCQSQVLPVAVPLDFWQYLDARKTELQTQLATVADLIERNELAGVRLHNGVLHISPPVAAEPAGMDEVQRRVYDLLPRTKITDLIAEVAGWTGFDRHFTHLRTGEPGSDREALFTAILAEGINLGLTKMADACDGMTYGRLTWTADWYLRENTYRKALAEVINFQHQVPFAAHWGAGSTSSSDGQRFPMGGRREARGAVNARYGQEPGISFYGHLSDQYSPYHMQPISVLVREAPYALDGLLYHESELQIREHYTDTGGYTDQVFAMYSLLDFKFVPRIRDLGDHRLYILGEPDDYPALEPLIGGTVNVRRLAEQWDSLLRLACSIRQGTVSASLILSKLAAYPRQNSLAWALREMGRLEKTLFVLEWLQDPELRRRVTAGLNKGEARHALARAVYVHRHGAVYDRSYEAQRLRASGLNLLVALIILWNTVHLGDAVAHLKPQGYEISDEQLRHLAPLGWDHIQLTGDYRWNMRLVAALEERRPVRAGPRLTP